MEDLLKSHLARYRQTFFSNLLRNVWRVIAHNTSVEIRPIPENIGGNGSNFDTGVIRGHPEGISRQVAKKIADIS